MPSAESLLHVSLEHALLLVAAGISQINKDFEPKDPLTCTAFSLQLAHKSNSHSDCPTMIPRCYEQHLTYTS